MAASALARISRLSLTLLCVAAAEASAEPARYELQPDGTRVRFLAKSTLHPFEGDTSAVRGDMVFDPVTNQLLEPARIAVKVEGLTTGIAARDRAMCRMFQSDEFPELLVTIDSLVPLDVSDPSARRYRLEGRLKIRQIEQPIAIDVDANLLGDGFEASGRLPLMARKMFQLKPPSVAGLIRVRDDLVVEFTSSWKRAR